MQKPKLVIADLSTREQLLLGYLVKHIRRRQHCPTNQRIINNGHTPYLVPVLARKGFIKIEVSSNNYRVITACFGRQIGKSTLRPVADWHKSTIIEYDPAYTAEYRKPSKLAVPDWDEEKQKGQAANEN